MRAFLAALVLSGGVALAQETPQPDPGAAAPPASAEAALEALEAPELPPGLAVAIGRDRSADAVEERSLTNEAMAAASASYIIGDYASALIHAERAAAGGEPLGATLAGHIRLHGLAGDQSDAAAVRWFRRAGELGEPDALIVLARLAGSERGGLSSWQAREFLAKAAEGGDARAAHEYGLHLMEAGDPGAAGQAIEWLRLAAESGRPAAYADYAYALGDWVHGPQDLGTAREWYGRAGDAGDGVAALLAGQMYLTGEGGEARPERGAALIAVASELGVPAAMGQRALLLFQGGAGLDPDPVRAAGWARQGAELGDSESQFLYAYALATGDGVARDVEDAYFWVLRAGHPGPDSLKEDPDRNRLEADRLQAEAAAAASPF